MASPAGAGGRLSILVLHRVLPQPDPMFGETVDARRFDQLCGWLARLFNVLPLPQAASRLAEGSLPARAAAITFDDGYADNHDVALPILQRHGLSATFYVSTGFLGDGVMWNDMIIESVRRTSRGSIDLSDQVPGLHGPLPLGDWSQRRQACERLIGACKYLPFDRRRAAVAEIVQRCGGGLPTDLMMSPEQVRALHAAGMQIGAHTESHPILLKLDPAEQRREMAGSKRYLENLLDERVASFAYPNGRPGEDFDATTVGLAREVGFELAVTTAHGAAARGTDLMQLPRFTPWDRTPIRFGLRMMSNLWTPHVPLPDRPAQGLSQPLTETR